MAASGRTGWTAALALLAVVVTAQEAPSPTADPFACLAPEVVISPRDRLSLDRNGSLARVLPGKGRQVAVFAAMPVAITPQRFVAWMRQVTLLKRGAHVPAIGRFSDQPVVSDLGHLSLDDGELDAIRQCKPGDCGLKLTAREIDRLHGVIASSPPDWKPRLQAAFHELIIDRVRTYLASGHPGLDSYADHDRPAALGAAFSGILEQSRFLSARLPAFAQWLNRFPTAPTAGVESFLYWSKEKLDGKALVSVTHVAILQPDDPGLPRVVVAGKQVFSTHYLSGSLGLTLLLGDQQGRSQYLVYVNRSETDVLGGWFSGFVRFFIERRLRNEAPAILTGLKARLEAGEPK